ncbi:MAG: thiol reductant ABC exporter subunit CydC, partial [Cutibacterium acnes]|nr:thiol reductant ABC exporter subunit CydC [Cutibacterium acnes]
MNARTTQLLKTLLRDVPRGRWLLVLSTLLAACASGASVALMGVSAWLLSRAAEMPPVLYLEAAAVGVRFFGISRGVFRYAERLVGHDLALRMQGALRMRVYDRLSRTTLLGRRRGDLLVRVTADVDAVLDMVVRVIVPACASSLVIIGTTVLLARFSLTSAAVLLLSALLAAVVMPAITQRLSRAADSSLVPLRGQLADRTRELAHCAPDLVAYGAQDAILADVLEVDSRLRTAEKRAAWGRGLGTAGQILAAGLAVVSALWIGGNAVADGRIGGRILAVLVLTPLALHEVFGAFTGA